MAEDLLDVPPSIIVYAPSGYGKTTALAKSFQKALWVVTSKDVLRPYMSWLRDFPEEAKKQGLAPIPDNRVIELPSYELGPEGDMLKVNLEAKILEILKGLAKLIVTDKIDIQGVIFDEWTAMATSVAEDIQKRTGKSYDKWTELVTFHKKICAWPKLTKRMLGLVCHETGPKYFDEGPKAGTIQYRGGPSIPGGNTIGEVCQAATCVLQIQLQVDDLNPSKPAIRKFRTEAHPLWERKFRDFSAKPEEDLDLRALLLRGGFAI